MEELRSCQTCKFFSALNNECHKEPPRVFPIGSQQGELRFFGVWPPTKATNWCGAYEMQLTVAVQ